MNTTEEFKEWIKGREIVNCQILNNTLIIAELNGKVFVGNSLNNNGCPNKLILCAEHDACSADIGYHYINKIIKMTENHWYVMTDSYQHYSLR